jgi:hypothetical protein
VIVDWFLATAAWLTGCTLSFDSAVRMDYRQHGANMVRTIAPFTSTQVRRDTQHVREHFRLLRGRPTEGCIPARLAEVASATADVELFYQQVVLHETKLQSYVQRLNHMNPDPLWWSSVAHPALRQMWSEGKIEK